MADRANVSIATASKALAEDPRISEATRGRVRSASEELGYTPARQAGVGRGQRLGLTLIQRRLEDPLYAAIVQHLLNEAAHQNLRMDVNAILEEEPTRIGERLRERSEEVQGLVLAGVVEPEVLAYIPKGKPLAVMGHLTLHEHGGVPPQVCSVVTDWFQIMVSATQRLLAKGHQRIALVAESTSNRWMLDRHVSAYQIALIDAGLTVDRKLIETSTPTGESIEPVARRLDRLKSPPTAFVIPDARVAAGFAATWRQVQSDLDADNCVTFSPPLIRQTYAMDHVAAVWGDYHAAAKVLLNCMRHALAGEEIDEYRILCPLRISENW